MMWAVGLVGRERECARLADVVSAVAAGSGDLVVVEGPGGIGKSALLQWLAQRCRSEGISLAAARATELGREVSFGLVRRLLDAEVRKEPGLLRTGWARRARAVFEGDAPGDGVAAPLVEGLLALVAELVRLRGPAVFSVDDAQWADPGSRLFLAELAERCSELGCALVLAVRRGNPGDEDPELTRIAALAQDGGT
ncbi:MAG TPA: ATP-binding protein, partial [Solirubrobacteraceae bacterium]|nr:ATP-binding protein [Solirubrobacteraceae bacterium]